MMTRKRILEATPVIVVTPKGGILVSRIAWRKAKALVERHYARSGYFACLSVAFGCLLEVASPESLWLIGWSIVLAFACLMYMMRGWINAETITVAFIVATVEARRKQE